MATTSIHPICQTIATAIDYVRSDKTEKKIKDDIADSIKYAVSNKNEEVTYFTLTSTQNCGNVLNPVEDFHYYMRRYGESEIKNGNNQTKNGLPVVGWHLVQSFEGIVNPRIANEIGRKLVKEVFPNHSAVISTHTNTENTHNHIIICAWNLDGKKWDQNNENYYHIRECSDRLCDEYGLSVLEKTRTQKLVKWFDKKGKVHFYEPTDRKNQVIEDRKNGKAYTDDVNSYRNHMNYELSDAKRRTNIAIVRQAIDEALPYAVSYEHLLVILRAMGMKIKDKRKNGEYLEHVTFIHPLAEKGVRDSSIDKETGFYKRENLSRYIKEQNRRADRNQPCLQNINYGDFNIECLDENFRTAYDEKRGFIPEQRTETEKKLIRIAKLDDELLKKTYDTSVLERLIALEKEGKKKKRPPQNRDGQIIRQIQESFETLRYIEKSGEYNYRKTENELNALKERYSLTKSKILELDKVIEFAEKKADISPEALQKYRDKSAELRNDLSSVGAGIEKYEGYIRTFDRINRENIIENYIPKTVKKTHEMER